MRKYRPKDEKKNRQFNNTISKKVLTPSSRKKKKIEMKFLTFSDTLQLLPSNNSGAIHGRVPLTPPETSVLRLILDRPKSPTY
jgi:hypothetical protein